MDRLPERMMVRSGTHSQRHKVPRDIVDRYGKRIEVVSLRTKDPKVAKGRNTQATADRDERFGHVPAAAQPEKLSLEAAPPAVERMASIARARATSLEDRLLVELVELFEAASTDAGGGFAVCLTAMDPC